jgi:hypothetical protein
MATAGSARRRKINRRRRLAGAFPLLAWREGTGAEGIAEKLSSAIRTRPFEAVDDFSRHGRVAIERHYSPR